MLIILTTFLYSILGIFSRTKTNSFAIIYILPLFLLVALRDKCVGPDTLAYYYNYYNLGNISTLIYLLDNNRMELGYTLLAYFFSRVGLSYYFFQIILTFLIYIPIVAFIKKYSINIGFSIFLFWITFYAFGTMNVTRMWMAVSILTLSTKYIISRSFFKFFAIVLLAMLFHKSAIVFVLLYYVYGKKINVKTISLLLVACVIITFFFNSFITTLTSSLGVYENYLTDNRLNTSENLAVKLAFMVNIVVFVFCCFVKAWAMKNGKNEISILSFYALVIVVGLGIIGLSFNMTGRVSYYFSIYLILLIPNAFNNIDNKKIRFILRLVYVFFLLLEFSTILYYRPEWYQVIPYNFFFDDL